MFLTYKRENVQKQQAIISTVNSDKIIKIPDGVKTSNPSLFKNGVTSFFFHVEIRYRARAIRWRECLLLNVT